MVAGKCVIARPFDFSAYIDSNWSVGNGSDIHLWVDDIGAKLLGEECLKLIDRQPFHVESAKAWKVERSIGANRELSAELRQVN